MADGVALILEHNPVKIMRYRVIAGNDTVATRELNGLHARTPGSAGAPDFAPERNNLTPVPSNTDKAHTAVR